MHGEKLPAPPAEKPKKKVIKKPEFWSWKNRTEPEIPSLNPPPVTKQGIVYFSSGDRHMSLLVCSVSLLLLEKSPYDMAPEVSTAGTFWICVCLTEQNVVKQTTFKKSQAFFYNSAKNSNLS